MITATRKPLDDIKAMIRPFKKVLIAGCGSCVAECAAGGEKEVAQLASSLRMAFKLEGQAIELNEITVDRQCVNIFLDQLEQPTRAHEAVLSLACGAGVQALAERHPDRHVFPALDTQFLGQTKEPGLWLENCLGCGQCKLFYFGAICPLARCAKQLFNGPCGGSQKGKCEVDPDKPCAWQLIIDRLGALNALDRLEEVFEPVDWSCKQGRGPRKIVREDQQS
ncbi:MAG: methylenetetrahydrofolate reductase C-terminal domain-containing protein [Deltaproteobacteria bacterium]|nr:methylenetetrahydrofolate reductase C-terminal domain-containing protein [Deltaproteobacteria bacterium]